MSDILEQTVMAPLELLGRQMTAILPNVLAMSILLLAGLAAAWLSSQFVERVFRVLGGDRLSDRFGVTAVLLRAGIKTDPSGLVGRGLYWIVVLVTCVTALGALDFAPINNAAHSLLAYLPHVIIASIIMTAGYLCSNFVAQAVLIAAVNAGLPPARVVATCSRWGVRLLAASMALEQLGIAQHIVVVGFGITWGGVVLAGAIAFGLGAADSAKQFLEGCVIGSRSAIPDDLRHW
ncbi:MAG TPA: hypothetical protein VFS39_04730 [Nitrospira sp.]|nr:hypothetical protein [Nitrospira sp.]